MRVPKSADQSQLSGQHTDCPHTWPFGEIINTGSPHTNTYSYIAITKEKNDEGTQALNRYIHMHNREQNKKDSDPQSDT